jgi:hypothetical protein
MVAGTKRFYNYTPLPWMYKFYYLKYLFIIIPGTIAGEWLMEASQSSAKSGKSNEQSSSLLLGGISVISLPLFGAMWPCCLAVC